MYPISTFQLENFKRIFFFFQNAQFHRFKKSDKNLASDHNINWRSAEPCDKGTWVPKFCLGTSTTSEIFRYEALSGVCFSHPSGERSGTGEMP